MGVLHGNPFLIASGSPTEPAVPLQRSLRLRSSASAYLNRTPASAGNRKTWTWSGWLKRGTLSSTDALWHCYGAGTNTTYFLVRFESSGALYIGNASTNFCITSQLLRDPSAWYHIVITLDTTQATAADRLKVYVNGSQVISFSSDNRAAQIAQNSDQGINQASVHTIGRENSGTFYLDGYLTEINFVDGQALTPSSFGGYNAGTNVWEVRKYSGTYGTNGFYLPFTNPASIGADGSGNGNNWTASAGIQTSNSALTTYDSMLDVPTNTGPTNANYPVWNPLNKATPISITNGNLQTTATTAAWQGVWGTLGVSSGKWYFEATVTANNFAANGINIGIALDTAPNNAAPGAAANAWLYNNNNSAGAGRKLNGATSTIYGATYTLNDVIGVAVDLDAGTLEFYKNGTSQGVAFSSGVSGTIFPYVAVYGTDAVALNCGQRPFAQTPPSGFKSLNTYNLPDPTIPRGDKYFKQYLYTGNGGGQQIGEIQKPMSLFNLDRSIRIRAAQNAYFSRLPTTNGNGQKFTISTWVKRGELGTGWTDTIFTGRTGTNFPELDIMFASDIIKLQAYTTGAALLMNVDTVNTYRNPAIWYHIVTAFDTTQTTPADRVKVYVNGIQQTIAAGVTYPSQNLVLNANQTVTQYIGSSPANTAWGDLYFADYYMIDGQQLTPTDFGQFDGNNYWTPKAYTGTYGTNGFHLEFEDYSAATASAIGKDTSGNNNNFTPTGINLTTPQVDNEYWDSYTDVPTLTSADASNYCVFDPLQFGSTELRNGNLTYVWGAASTAYKYRGTTTLTTGKWYFEGNIEAFTIGNAGNTNYAFGFIAASGVDTHISFGWTTNGTSMKLGYRYDVAGVIVQNVTYNTTAPISTDIFGVEYDVDNGTANFYKNGTLMGSASGLALGSVNPHIWRTGTSNSATMHVNFGQRAFKYTPSTGYKKINAFNVAEIIGDVESPDFVWIKSRSATNDHTLFNSISGVGKYLRSSNTGVEVTDVNSLIQFNKNGILLGNSTIVNTSAATYVANLWKAGNSTVTNTNGSISSQVRANQTAGFSIVKWTAPSTAIAYTVGHGLGIEPSLILMKDSSSNVAWIAYHKSVCTTTAIYLVLNSTAITASAAGIWGSALPTPTVFGNTAGTGVNGGSAVVAYCFSEIEGFSKFGSYLSNNDSNGPFVYTGFRPRWLMVKRAVATAGSTGGWFMYDAARNTSNVMDKYLFAEGTAGENTLAVFDFTSNGFKIRSANVHVNTTAGDRYIYMAFAENPFKYALAR